MNSSILRLNADNRHLPTQGPGFSRVRRPSLRRWKNLREKIMFVYDNHIVCICRHETLTHCWLNVWPASQTVIQHSTNYSRWIRTPGISWMCLATSRPINQSREGDHLESEELMMHEKMIGQDSRDPSSHIEQWLCGRRSVWHTKSSEFSITPLHETRTRLTVDGWRISVELQNSCSHREQGLWKEPFCETHEAVSSLS